MYYRSQRLSDIRGNNLILYFVTRYKGDQQILTQYRKVFLEIQLCKTRMKKLYWFLQQLSISLRVKIKVSMMTGKALHDFTLLYLSGFISYYSCLTNFAQAILASGVLNRLCTWCSLYMGCFFPRHLRISPLQISPSLLDLLQPFKTATASHPYCLFLHSLIFLLKTYQHRNTVQSIYFVHGLVLSTRTWVGKLFLC